MTTPKRYPTTFPLPPDYSWGDALPADIPIDPNRTLQGWTVDAVERTITLLYAD